MTQESGLVRISVAPLVLRVCNTDTEECSYFGILNPKAYCRGETKIQALGGAAHITQKLKEHLEESFRATDFEQDKDGSYDARFLVPAYNADAALAFFQISRDAPPDFYERELRRELLEELCTVQILGMPPILAREEAEDLIIYFVGTYRQPPPIGEDTSSRAGANPTRRLFLLFSIFTSEESYRNILGSRQVQELMEDEIATTQGGAMAGRTRDGHVIANNIFPYPD